MRQRAAYWLRLQPGDVQSLVESDAHGVGVPPHTNGAHVHPGTERQVYWV